MSGRAERADEGLLKGESLATCRASPPAHQAPTALRFLPALAMTADGKLERASGL